MKVYIKYHYFPVVDLAVNIFDYLKLQGNDVYFLDTQDIGINNFIKRLNKKILFYPDVPVIERFSGEEDIVRLIVKREHIKDVNKLLYKLNVMYSKAYYFLKNNKPDALLLFNGELDVESYVAKDLGIKTWYLDDGHFPNTYQMNLGGANAKADFANLSFEEFLKFHYSENNKVKKINFIPTKVSREWYYTAWALSVLHKILDNRKLLPRIKLLLEQFYFLFFKKNLRQDNVDLPNFGDFIFFPLQVNNDTQIQINSSYKDNFEILDYIIPYIKKTSYKLILKPHPFEIQKIDYSRYVDNKQIFLINGDLNELIEKSKFLIVVNSSVGLQAIAKYKKLLLLGDSFYKHSKNVINIPKGDDLLKYITQVEKLKVNKEEIDEYIKKFYELFLHGSARNQKIDSLTEEFFYKLAKRV